MPTNSRFPDTQSFIAITLILAIIGVVFVLLFRGAVPDSDVLKMLIGGLMTVGFATIINYYFGSSTGSKDKDTAMSSVVERLTPVPPPTNGPAVAPAAVTAAAVAAAPAAAANAAPPAAAAAAPPAAEAAVEHALAEHGLPQANP